MPRPAIVSDADILSAARALYLERGAAATTAQVAERLGVSEGTLFYRFHSKFELFRAAVCQGAEIPAECLGALEAAAGDIPRAMRHIGMELIATLRGQMPLLMMRWSSPDLAAGEAGPLTGTLADLEARLVAFVDTQAAAGRIRRVDTEVLARAFLGALHSYVFFTVVVPTGRPGTPTPERFVNKLVDVLWNGLDPEHDRSQELARGRCDGPARRAEEA